MAAATRETGSKSAAGTTTSAAAASRPHEQAHPAVDEEGEPYFLFEDSDWPGSFGATTNAIP